MGGEDWVAVAGADDLHRRSTEAKPYFRLFGRRDA
jgi:hypothetical protein